MAHTLFSWPPSCQMGKELFTCLEAGVLCLETPGGAGWYLASREVSAEPTRKACSEKEIGCPRQDKRAALSGWRRQGAQ